MGVEAVPRQPEEALRIRPDARRALWRFGTGEDAAQAVALIGREGGDEYQAHHVGGMAGSGDHGTAIGVPHQQCRPREGLGQLAGALHIVGQGGEGILHRADRVTGIQQQGNQVAPVGGIAPGAMDQQDIGQGGHGRLPREYGRDTSQA
ncbi:hypothetical protein D3C84_873430 [compost metagenome]